MFISIATGIIAVILSVLLSIGLAQIIRTALNRYRQTMRSVDQANMAASEIKRLLAGRSLRCKGLQ